MSGDTSLSSSVDILCYLTTISLQLSLDKQLKAISVKTVKINFDASFSKTAQPQLRLRAPTEKAFNVARTRQSSIFRGQVSNISILDGSKCITTLMSFKMS